MPLSFAFGEIFVLSWSVTFPLPFRAHAVRQTPHVARLNGSALGLAIMMALWVVSAG